MDEISFETMSDEEEEELGAHSSPSSYRDPDETESSDEAADAKKMKDSLIHTSVNFKEGESLIDVRRRVGKQLKMDLILFDFWYADHKVEDGKTMKDFDIFHKSAKIRLEIQENSSGGRLNIEGFYENLFVGESESEDEAVVQEQEAEEEDHNQLEEEDAVQEEEDGKVKVFCAGFCFDNGKPEARAGVGVYWGKNDARNKSCRVRGIKQTTRTAEVQAATMAITEAIRNMISDLQLHTDKFVYTSVKNDMKRWKQKGWKTARGKDLQNKNDWQELDRQLKTAEENNLNIEWKFWTGEGKKEATDLATEGARLYN